MAQPALLRYPGSKWTLAPKIVSMFGPHYHYVEPYFGSGAVFFNKEPSRHEVINDINGDVVNFWKTLRDDTEELVWKIEATPWARDELAAAREPTSDPVEAARRFAVRAWQSRASDQSKNVGWRYRGAKQRAGGMSHRWQKLPAQLQAVAGRLSDAEIEHKDALDVIAAYSTEDTLLYLDPPYVFDTDRTQALYANEVDDTHHAAMLELAAAHPGPVVISGYDSALYDEHLDGWQKVSLRAGKVEGGARRTEVLWTNRAA